MNNIKENIQNEQILNILNFKKESLDNEDIEIKQLNKVLRNNIPNEYNVLKMVGNDNFGKLYLLTNNNKDKFICKKINKKPITNQIYNQLNFELKLLKYLGSNTSVKKFINPCLDNYIDKKKNYIYTIFPVINGITLGNFKKNFNSLTKNNSIEIKKRLIKSLLNAFSKIHKLNIIHHNINENNIIVMIDDMNTIDVKITDFGLGCGFYKIPKNDIYNLKNNNYLQKKCDSKDFKYNFKKIDLDKLKNSTFLINGIKYDVWKLGTIFINLIMPDIDIDIDINDTIDINTNDYFIDFNKKYREQILNNIENVDNKLLLYLKNIIEHMISDKNDRKNCDYIMDNIILSEKYD